MPADAGHLRLTAELAVGADFAGDARDFGGEGVELVHHGVDGVLQLENFAFHVDRDLARQIAAGNGRRDFGDVSHLAGKVAGHGVDGVGEILPRAGDAGHVGLTAQAAFATHFAGHAGDFGGERSQLLDHRVERFFQLQNFAANVDRDLLREIAVRDSRRDFGDVSHLAGQVAGHEVDVVGEIFPGSGDAGHLRLATKFAVGADFAGHAGDFAGESVELVHHRVDGVLQFENFAFHVDRDLAGQVAASNGRRDFGDVSHLAGEVSGHGVDGVGEIFPRSGNAGHLRLAAKLAFGADFAGHAGNFAGERVELVDHRVDGFFEQQNFAADVDRDFLRQVAAGDRSGYFSDVTHLASQVAGHGVDGVGEIFPGSADAGDLRLSAEFAVGADFAGDARDFRCERTELVHHGVDGVFQLEDFAFHVDRDLARQVAASDGCGDFGDVSNLASQVAGHEVDVVGEILPGAGHARDLRLAAEFAFGTDFAGHARYFAGEGVELVHHRVDGVLEFENFALHVDRDLARQVAAGDGRRDFGDVSDLAGEVSGHGVDGVGEILPRSGDAGHVGLSAESTFGTDFAGHAGDFAGEPVELVDHRVEGFFQLQDFAAHVDRDFARQIAAGDGCRDFGDVSNLASQVAGHEVDVVGEIFPCAANAGHLRLAAELAFGTDFAGHARDFASEGVQLVDHRVDGVFEFENFALHVDGDFAGQIAAGHSGRDFGDVSDLGRKVAGHGVDGVGEIFPGAGHAGHDGLSAELAVGADFAGHARYFRSEGTQLVHHRVDGFFELQEFRRAHRR